MAQDTARRMTPGELLIAFLFALALAFGFFYWTNSRSEMAKRQITIRRMLEIETALQKYSIDCGGILPTTKQGLEALWTRPTQPPIPIGWRGGYISDPKVLEDGWGRKFKYFCPGKPYPGSKIKRPYDLASYGRDGREGGEGLDRDICNWDRKTLAP